MEEYRMYTKKSETDKAIHMLEGILKGISYDSKINDKELKELDHWIHIYKEFKDSYPFNELFMLLEEILEDNIVTKEEKKDLLWFCEQVTTDSKYYDVVTSDLQRLHGIIFGIISDKVIKDSEIHKLKKWLENNKHLASSYPYDELVSVITTILADGIITEDEKKKLERHLLEFIDEKDISNYSKNEINDIKESITVSGICAMDPEIEINDSKFVITGKSSNYSRKEFKQFINEKGGKVTSAVSGQTNYLIVCNNGNPCWAYSCYGRKIEKAIDIRKDGGQVIIVHENDFMDKIY